MRSGQLICRLPIDDMTVEFGGAAWGSMTRMEGERCCRSGGCDLLPRFPVASVRASVYVAPNWSCNSASVRLRTVSLAAKAMACSSRVSHR
jgi:hypothetical protein